MNRNLHPGQFEQLKMFMTPDEVIDKTEKLDTSWRTAPMSPRQQWEHPESSGHESLRDYKLRDALEKEEEDRHGRFKMADLPYETMPPLHIVKKEHGPEGEKLKFPMLMDGHHRLALAEHRGHPYVAVIHHNTEDEWDEYGY